MPLLQAIPRFQCSSLPPQNSTTGSHQCQKKSQKIHQPLPLKSTCLNSAHQLLDQIPPTDTFACNTLIATHLADGEPTKAVFVYQQMLLRSARPDKYTIPRVLTASSLAGAFFGGRQVHGHAVKFGFAMDEYVVTALMTMYAQFEGADAARKIFDGSSRRNSVSWTQLAKLYLGEGKPHLALRVFEQMLASSVEIDSVALATALKACGQLKSVHEGRKVHDIARRKGLEYDLLVGNSLLKMYVECENIENGRNLLEQMPTKDAVSWTTVIGGYVQAGEFNEGMKLFRTMCIKGTKPDSFAVSALLPACARMTARKNGKEIHGYIIRHGVEMNLTVQNALMDMYAKSSCLESASNIFKQLIMKDAISWTVMIFGYSLHGKGELGVELFRKMESHSDVLLDRTAYAAVLHACNTAGMVEEGRFYFNCIDNPAIEHYALMVSLLARARRFEEAATFIRDHRVELNMDVQRALLDGCRIHRNVKLGKRVAERLIEMEPLNAENYILMSNLHAANAKWDAVEEMRQTFKDMGLKAKKAYSWIEVRNKVHVFGVGDVSHPRSERIYWELQGWMKKMEEEGHLLENDFSLHEVDEERECIPSGHSELLAIAFGLISIQGNEAIRVTKNLPVCRNCHSSAKMLSKIVDREIVLKDLDRFHHFRNGVCSCRDCC